MKINAARVWLGGIAGAVVWIAWGFFVGMRQAPLYEAMQKQGLFLKEPRYAPFAAYWILVIFVMAILIAHLYAWARATAGPGFKTALKVRWILRRRARQLGTSRLVAGSHSVAVGMDARPVGRLNPGGASCRVPLQGIVAAETRHGANDMVSTARYALTLTAPQIRPYRMRAPR
jgi:hypothetical protein